VKGRIGMNVDKKMIIGITGFTHSGKSLAAAYFKKNGFYIIDVDKLAHQLYKKHTFLYKKIVQIYGKNILNQNLTIDRKKLASLIFSNTDSYKKFCSLVYPALNKAIINKLKKIKQKLIILDMAVLFETGIYKKIDYIIFIKVSKRIWLNRINKHPEASSIKKVFFYQNIFNISKKIALSDFIIYNNGSKKELYNNIISLSNQLKGDIWKKKKKNKKNKQSRMKD
jgi:dephospho-CoA kinase